jgi:hypothetical protein
MSNQNKQILAHVEKALRLLEQGYEPVWAKVELREAIFLLKGASK